MMINTAPGLAWEQEELEWYIESMEHVSIEELYTKAEPSWSNSRERFPTRLDVLLALYSISKLK